MATELAVKEERTATGGAKLLGVLLDPNFSSNFASEYRAECVRAADQVLGSCRELGVSGYLNQMGLDGVLNLGKCRKDTLLTRLAQIQVDTWPDDALLVDSLSEERYGVFKERAMVDSAYGIFNRIFSNLEIAVRQAARFGWQKVSISKLLSSDTTLQREFAKIDAELKNRNE